MIRKFCKMKIRHKYHINFFHITNVFRFEIFDIFFIKNIEFFSKI